MPRATIRLVAIAVLLPAPAPAQSPPPPAGADPAVLVESVGLLAGHQLHQAYQTLELLGVARFFSLYEAGELSRKLTITVRSLDETEKQLGKLVGLKGLGKADAATLARFRKIAGLLREQGETLQWYWDTGVADHWNRSEKAREAAWKELDAALGLNPKKGLAPPPREVGKKR